MTAQGETIVTPFDAWYSSVIAPNLEQTLKCVPPVQAKALRESSRAAMAACWNAALRAVSQTRFTREEFPPPCQLPAEIREQIAELEARTASRHSQRAGDPMTFADYWESRECEIAAEQSLRENRLSILAAHAWNAALEATRAIAVDELEDLKVTIS